MPREGELSQVIKADTSVSAGLARDSGLYPDLRELQLSAPGEANTELLALQSIWGSLEIPAVRDRSQNNSGWKTTPEPSRLP